MIEPLYSLDVAAELIPLSKSALCHILFRKSHLFKEPIYHTFHNEKGAAGMVRMLRESEVLQIRNIVIHRWERDEKRRYTIKKPGRLARFLSGEDYVGHPART